MERGRCDRRYLDVTGWDDFSIGGVLTTVFTPGECLALLGAVATHDTIDPASTLPMILHFDYNAALLSRTYWISRQLWRDVDRSRLAALASRIACAAPLNAYDLAGFKDIRMRAKQSRFAYGTLSAGHRYPARLDRLTRLMGQAQDAMRTGRRVRATLRGLQLRLAVSRQGWSALAEELDAFAPATPAALRRHVAGEIDVIDAALARPAITDRDFHDTRKVVSRLVAFYDTLTVLAPSPTHMEIDRYLGTINGLMGARHDDMVVDRANSRRGYRDRTRPMPADIAERLARLVAAARAGGRSAQCAV